MFNQENQFTTTSASSGFAPSVTYDAGLRSHMLRIFNTVAAGLAISGVTAYAVFAIPMLRQIFLNPMVSMITGIGLMLFLWFGMSPAKAMHQSVASLQVKYYLFTAVLGTSLAYIFAVYSGASVARVFFITAAMFAGTGLIGYTTKRDLSGMGTFLIMGLIGVILASLVNMFFHSTAMAFVISIISVLVFTGLIAFETQNAKRMYSTANGDETNHKMAIFSALGLYINFINLFQTLLRLFGGRN
ncbi:MAG: rane protein [Alphaproteobacteria bacterium]|nr:rane protein [Alphaproteobacteria bacterium]